MTADHPQPTDRKPRPWWWQLFNLRSDQASYADIDASIREASRAGGTNLWVLVFAIVIASVGLNVNSTAVIIGAMLISPLMGPIIGMGYGAAVFDHGLIRQCARTLVLFVGFSLLASTLYFWATPLKVATSELLARTTPTLWDVMIAFFGGAAGMVGLSRREKTNLLPGVAIATALMPPICTAGYGAANGQLDVFAGAFYLFLINAVFIALATLLFGRILRLPEHAEPDPIVRKRGRLVIGMVVVVTLVPSAFLAYRLVQDEVFSARAHRFVDTVSRQSDDITVVNREVSTAQRNITLTVLGAGATPVWRKGAEDRLKDFGLVEARLHILAPDTYRQDMEAMRNDLTRAVARQVMLADKSRSEAQASLAEHQRVRAELSRLEAEIKAQLPGVRSVNVAASEVPGGSGESSTVVVVAVDATPPLPRAEALRLKRWLAVRLGQQTQFRLIVGRLA